MKYKIYFLYIFFLFLCDRGSTLLNAQQHQVIESQSQAHFQQLDIEQKKAFFQSWMNKSTQTSVPQEFEKKAIEYYVRELQSESMYKKYIGVFKPIFNNQLHTIDRVNFCLFILEYFSDEEVPMQLIREQKSILINSTIK